MDIETKDAIMDQLKLNSEGLQAMRDTVKTIDGKVEGLDGLDMDKFNKAAEDASTALETVQKLQAGVEAKDKAEEAFEARMDTIEKAVARGVKAGNGGEKGGISDYQKSLSPILRKEGDARMDMDENKKNISDMVKLYLPHLDDTGHKAAVALTAKTLLTGSGPDGGYWVPVDRIQAMITQIFETSPMRQLASTITTASNAVSLLIDDDEFTATWGNELSIPQNDPTPQIGELTIAVHNLFARAPITENMLEDSTIDIVGWITRKATDKFSRTENTAFVVGDGTNKPRGILTYPVAADPDAYERGAIGRVSSISGTGGVIVSDDFFNLQNHVKEPYQANATWMLKRRSWFNVATLKDNDGQYLLRFGDALAGGVGMRLLNQPVVFADDMPNIAVDAVPIAYGDFRAAYTIIDRVGMGILVDPYSEDPKIRYRFRKRLGGAVTNYEAVKLLVTDA